MIERLRARRFSLLETIGLLALGLWSADALSHALTLPGVAPGETARASDVQQIVAAVSALEAKLQYVTVLDGAYKDMAGPHLVIRGANLHLESGSGQTSDGGAPTGLGNLVLGYGENAAELPRKGSHTLMIGEDHGFTGYAGLLAGRQNRVSGAGSAAVGGAGNAALADYAAALGGFQNQASAAYAVASGGRGNLASGPYAAASGGYQNAASGAYASVSGGRSNDASGESCSVSGGRQNAASGAAASVSGGYGNAAAGEAAAVSGGFANEAQGVRAVVGGGRERVASGEDDWAAGALSQDQ